MVTMSVGEEANNRQALIKQNNETVTEEMIEITTYIREDQALALEIIGNARRYSPGVNFDRGTIIREALDLLIEKNIV